MVQCQRITGDSYKDVLGIARDSPIYYQMKKSKKDLQEARETLARFEVPRGERPPAVGSARAPWI